MILSGWQEYDKNIICNLLCNKFILLTVSETPLIRRPYGQLILSGFRKFKFAFWNKDILLYSLKENRLRIIDVPNAGVLNNSWDVDSLSGLFGFKYWFLWSSIEILSFHYNIHKILQSIGTIHITIMWSLSLWEPNWEIKDN